MVIVVNGKQQEVNQKEILLSDLLVLNKVEMPDMVSVQLNGEFVDKMNFKTTVINDKDSVDFLYFMGGGGL